MDGRNINNLQGLLRFALQYTKTEDAPNESAFQQMDPERREFLENVFKSMSIDVIEEFRKAIEILELEESSTEEKLNALDVIGEYVDNIDFANNFIKIGGSKIIISCLSSDRAEIRASSANLIAELTQNNPFSQKHFTEQNILPKLIELLKDKNEKVACAALYGISCLVRHYEQALVAFIKIDGIKYVLECLKDDHQPKVFIKACFLLNALSTEFTLVRDEFIKNGAFEKIAKFLEPIDHYDTKLETVLSTLDTLSSLENNKDAVNITEEIITNLRLIMDKCGDKPECQEIIEHCRNILDKTIETEENAKLKTKRETEGQKPLQMIKF